MICDDWFKDISTVYNSILKSAFFQQTMIAEIRIVKTGLSRVFDEINYLKFQNLTEMFRLQTWFMIPSQPKHQSNCLHNH